MLYPISTNPESTPSTVPAYKLGWNVGEDKMLLVSIGTGKYSAANAALHPSQMHLLYNAVNLPAALMHAANNEQDMLCRVFGRCRAGDALDTEIGTLMEQGKDPLSKHFTYLRYNAELSLEGLAQLGLGHIKPEDVQKLDSVDHIEELREIGKAIVKHKVKAKHFEGFLALG